MRICLPVFVALLIFTVAPAMAQDGSTYVEGTVTEQVTGTEAYANAEAVAAESPYNTNEGNTEWNSNAFDGATATGAYQDTETLQPGGTYAEPNSDPQQ